MERMAGGEVGDVDGEWTGEAVLVKGWNGVKGGSGDGGGSGWLQVYVMDWMP